MYFLRKSYLFRCFGLVYWIYSWVGFCSFLWVFCFVFGFCFVVDWFWFFILFCWCVIFRGKGCRGFFVCVCLGLVLVLFAGVLLGFGFFCLVFWLLVCFLGFWGGCFVLVAFLLYLLIHLFILLQTVLAQNSLITILVLISKHDILVIKTMRLFILWIFSGNTPCFSRLFPD